MVNSYRTVTKQASPGISANNDYIVNIYYKGTFKFAYRYKDWTEDAVALEVKLLRSRFPDSNGFVVKW